MSSGADWKPNPGRKPQGAKGKRVRVKLRRGGEPVYANATDQMAPPGWAADTTRWTIDDDPFDVTHFIIL